MKRRRERVVRRQSKLMLLMIALVAAVVIASCAVKTVSLQEREQQLAVTESSLDGQIEDAYALGTELDAQRAYMKSDKYIEEEARDKLGLVKPGEIIIKPRED